MDDDPFPYPHEWIYSVPSKSWSPFCSNVVKAAKAAKAAKAKKAVKAVKAEKAVMAEKAIKA